MSNVRSDRGFRFPLDKYHDKIALHTNFKYLQEYLNYIRKKDKFAATIDIALAGSEAEGRAAYTASGTNDQVTIQAAIDALPASGGHIYLHAGTYDVQSNISLPSGKRILFTGPATISLNFPTNEGIGTYAFTGNGGRYIFDGLAFTGDMGDTATGSWSGVVIGFTRFWIVNCDFINLNCSKVIGGRNTTEAYVVGNRFENITLYETNIASPIGGVVSADDGTSQLTGLVVGNFFENIDGSELTGAGEAAVITRQDDGQLLTVGNTLKNLTGMNINFDNPNSHNIIDGTMVAGTHTGLDHGSLVGLADDDHTQYLLANGTRNLTAKLEFDEASEPAAPGTDDVVVWAEDEQGFGTLHWKASEDIAFELSRDRHLIARNQTGAQINAGEAVYISGSTGTVPNIAKAKADASATMPAVGIAISDIADTSFGRVKLAGDIDDLDLSSFNDGDVLYVSDATAGALTATKPAAGSLKQPVGSVTAAGTGANGIFLVDVGNALVEADIDHGSLGGLSDDDHPQYFSESNSAEISALTQKTPLVVGDHVLIEDSEASNAKKRATVGDIQSAETDHGGLTGLADDDHSFYPKGTLGYAEVTASQLGISTETDLTGLSVTVTVGTGRRIRITGHTLITQKTGAGQPVGKIYEDGVAVQRYGQHDLGAEERVVLDGSGVQTPASGSHTYKLTLATNANTVNMDAASTVPAFILVEDIGPA